MNNHPIADILSQSFDNYIAKYGEQSYHIYRVVHRIINCRSKALGGHKHTCDVCGTSIPLYNSCCSRHCPQCQYLARTRWVDARKAELLPVPYFHVVFTIPHELNPFALRNKEAFYSIMFRSLSETLLALGNNSKWLGASLGFVAVLHTWGQNLVDHPHIHCIVPAGGLSRSETKWVPCKDSFLFPFKAMKDLFSAKVLDYFKQALNKGEISFHGDLARYQDKVIFNKLISALYKKDWVVYVKQPFAGPAAVVEYLGNYTHRTAISERRINDISDNKVTFKYKDYKDDALVKLLTIDHVEFIRRFLLHILPKGFMRIRSYGFLSNKNRAKGLEQCAKIFALLRERLKSKEVKVIWYERLKEIYGKDPRRCKVCNEGIMKRVEKIEPVRPKVAVSLSP